VVEATTLSGAVSTTVWLEMWSGAGSG